MVYVREFPLGLHVNIWSLIQAPGYISVTNETFEETIGKTSLDLSSFLGNICDCYFCTKQNKIY